MYKSLKLFIKILHSLNKIQLLKFTLSLGGYKNEMMFD